MLVSLNDRTLKHQLFPGGIFRKMFKDYVNQTPFQSSDNTGA